MDLIGVRDIRMPRARNEISFAPGEQPLGGGTWLFSEQQPELTGLVDLTALGWEPVTRTDTHLVIAATCTIRQLTEILPEPDWSAHRLFELCANSLLMSFKIWNLATVGGNIATALPAGAMTSLMASLDAVAVVWSADGIDERRIPVADLVTGVRQTALGAGEVIRSIEIPLASLRSRVAFRRIALSNLGRSGALVIGRADADGGVVVTVSAATPAPVRLRFDRPGAADLEHALDGIRTSTGWYDDPHGAPDWREALSRRFVHEVVEELA